MIDDIDQKVADALMRVMEKRTGDEQLDSLVDQSLIMAGAVSKFQAMVQEMEPPQEHMMLLHLMAKSLHSLCEEVVGHQIDKRVGNG